MSAADARVKQKRTHKGRTAVRAAKGRARSYGRIRAIDGRHPLASAAPSVSIEYPARRRHDSKIAYFNFALAREIGLIPARHPDRLTPGLKSALLQTFGLVIVNEWDEAHGHLPPARDRAPHGYMATRYLQLQHPDKRGLNSGDGRSIWNGIVKGPNGAWDVSSCGTGVTRLCPATSETGEFFRTGNGVADYGCGTAHVEEGIAAALMSEAFARNGIKTERVLAVLARPSGFAINVRVAPNLLRPSHFFGLLRRREDEDLRGLVAYYAEREIHDGRWPKLQGEPERIRYLARRVALDFARAAARFESDYIFCWLDWDGDNILTDGSIIDYGSVRQFGLYHHSYRFEDTDRMSTSIPEQKRKARQIVQRFVQIRELLLTGELPALSDLAEDEVLAEFDREFASEQRRLFLHRVGFDDRDAGALLRAEPACLESLLHEHRRLERSRSSRGPHRVPDGFSWDAVYCMRDVLRKLPRELLENEADEPKRITPEAFFDIANSAYAKRNDRKLTSYRRRQANAYQRHYLALTATLGELRGRSTKKVLEQIAPNAAALNPYARITGDGLTHATRRVAVSRGRLTPEEIYRLLQAFADDHQTEGEPKEDRLEGERELVQRIHRDLLKLTREYRESL